MATQELIFKVPAAVGAPALPPALPDAGDAAGAARVAYDLAHPRELEVWRATGHEEPVFLDRRGRRRPLVGLAGSVAALAGAGWLAAVVTGAIGFSDLPGVPAALPGTSSPGGAVTVLAQATPHRPVHALVAQVNASRAALPVRPRVRPAVDIVRGHRHRDVDRAPRIVRV